MTAVDCRHFNGYKPCLRAGPNSTCGSACPSLDAVDGMVVVVHLGAIGAVVRSTSLLSAIRRENPKKYLVWITADFIVPLLKDHPKIDRVLGLSSVGQLMTNLKPQRMYVIDKCIQATGLIDVLQPKEVFGFKMNPVNLSILPANPEAAELWSLGLDNNKKFFINQRSEISLTAQALNLSTWKNDDYDLPLSEAEEQLSKFRKKQFQKYTQQPVIGINTGCSSVISYKKMSIELHVQLIQQLQKKGFKNIVLLGGPEDQSRNQEIAFLTENVFVSPTNLGLRDGLCSVDACDIVITGDSLGMHMAIARQKWVVAWFGPTCAQEIEMFGRGKKVVSDLPCAPCWKRSCEKSTKCCDLVSIDQILKVVEEGIKWMYPFEQPTQTSWAE